MKTLKKLSLGLGLLVAVLSVGLLTHNKAAAAGGLTTTQLDNAVYKVTAPDTIQGTIAGQTISFKDNNVFDPNHNFKPQNNTLFCDGTPYGNNGPGDALKGITLDTSFSSLAASGGTSINTPVNLDYLDASGNCQNYQKTITFTEQADGSWIGSLTNVTGACDPKTNPDCFCSSQGCAIESSTVPQTPSAGDTCQANADGFSLAWLLCPVLDAADALANATTGLFENQLSFRVSDYTQGSDQTHTTWALIRDISSALLVVVMLVMVISQATGSGPFEAYTVRKLLPKLVIAVILMQISWSLLGYMVNLVDDIGHGLKDLIYLPFRPGNLDDFWMLLSHAHIGTGAAAATSWLTLTGVVIGVAFALPTILMFAFIAIIADLTGLAVLVFRKILILMAVLFAPLALLAWILPGTQSYFKLWYSNFLKALFMFPLAILLIASGRIFAFVAGTTGNGTFINFFLVMVGFFGPLFILPKTFKWGGQAMQLVGNAATKAVNSNLIGKDAKPIKYFQGRQQNWNEARSAESQRRYGLQRPFDPRRFWQYPLDRLRAGEYDPLMGRAAWMPAITRDENGNRRIGRATDARMRRRKMTGYKEAGLKTEEEDQAAANREVVLNEKRLNETGYGNGGYNHDHYHQDSLRGELDWYNRRDHDRGDGQLESYADRDEREYVAEHGSLEGFVPGYRDYEGRVMPVGPHRDQFQTNAILNRLEELGADTNHQEVIRYVKQELASRDPERIRRTMKWLQDNKDPVLKNYPHLLKGRGSALDANELFGVHGAGGGDIVADTTWAVNHARDAARQHSEQSQLRKYAKTYLENATSTRRDSIEQGFRRVMRSLGASGDPVADEAARRAILIRNPQTGEPGVNTTRENRTYGTTIDPDTHAEVQITDRNGLTHLAPIEITPEVLFALGPNFDPDDPRDLTAELGGLTDISGAYLSGTGRGSGGGSPRGTPPVGGAGDPVGRPTYESSGGMFTSGAAPATPEAAPSSAGTAPTASAAPVAAPSFGGDASHGSYESTAAPAATHTTERVVREVSPTIISPTNTTIIQQAPAGEAQTVYTRPPQGTPTPAAGSVDRRTTEELDYQLRSVYRELKKLGARSQQQQQQFESLRNQHPDWDDDDS